MDLHRLAVFVKVYELKSLSRSAEAVYLSQPTVSGHLKGLEQELGVHLFDRLSRGVAPTAAADLLYDYARRLLALRDEALAAVTGLSGQVRGRLLVGGSTIPGQYLLPVHLAELRRRYPELEVSLAVAGTQSIGQQVEAGQLELGVIGARLDSPRLNYAPCFEDELVLALEAGHAWAGRGEIGVRELRNLPFLLREAASGTRMVTARALEGLGLKLSELKIVAELGSTEAVRQAIRSGLGASILSRLAVEEDLKSGRLVQLAVKGLSLKRDFYLVTRTGRSLSPGGQALFNLLTQEV